MDADRAPRRGELLAYQVAGAVLVLAIWSLLTYPEVVNNFILPTPTSVMAALVRGLTEGDLLQHVVVTLREFGVVLAVSIALGVALGVAPGLVPAVHRSVEPLISLALTIPIVTWFGVLVVLFGYGSNSVLALGVVAAAPVMLVSTITAFKEVDRALVRVGRVYTASRAALFRKVLLPGAVPTLASGVRIAAGRALIGALVGEMFMSSNGLGARLITATGFFDIPGYYAVVVALAVISYAIALVFSAIEDRMTTFNL